MLIAGLFQQPVALGCPLGDIFRYFRQTLIERGYLLFRGRQVAFDLLDLLLCLDSLALEYIYVFRPRPGLLHLLHLTDDRIVVSQPLSRRGHWLIQTLQLLFFCKQC